MTNCTTSKIRRENELEPTYNDIFQCECVQQICEFRLLADSTPRGRCRTMIDLSKPGVVKPATVLENARKGGRLASTPVAMATARRDNPYATQTQEG